MPEKHGHFRKSGFSVSLEEFLLEAFHGGEIQIENDLEAIDRKTKVHRLKEGLSARDWFVLEGKYILGYTDAEFAKQLGVAPDSIRMILTIFAFNTNNGLHADKKCEIL